LGPPGEKSVDRPHRLTLALASFSLLVSVAAAIVSGMASSRSYRARVENLLVAQSGIVVHSLRVKRVSDRGSGSYLVFSIMYQNSFTFSVNRLKAQAYVNITDREAYLLPESVVAPEFSSMLMARQEKGVSIIVHPSNAELGLADSGEMPIEIGGGVYYEAELGPFGYNWNECYMFETFETILPCPVRAGRKQ
jgi:hypothetical protein